MANANQREVFVQNLREFMAARGKRQIDIVEELGYPQSLVSDWMNGKKYPRVDAMERLADYLNVYISDLTNEKNRDVETVMELDEDEKEIVRIFRGFSRREKHEMMVKIYELERLFDKE